MKRTSLTICALALAACGMQEPTIEGPQVVTGGELVASKSSDYIPLADIPARRTPIPIAVYTIPDMTGANLRTEDFAEFSKAVTQGADALVLEALSQVGGGSWFRILERNAVESVLQERRMAISQTEDLRQRQHVATGLAEAEAAIASIDQTVANYRSQLERDYAAATPEQLQDMPPYPQALADLQNFAETRKSAIAAPAPYNSFTLPPALPEIAIAKYIVTGAIVAHDSDVLSRGTGLRIQNVGLVQRVQKDVITVNLRLVRVADAEVVANRTVSQTVLSRQDQGDVLNYITLNRILEFETGVVTNEPRSLALDAALRLAIHGILQDMEGRWAG